MKLADLLKHVPHVHTTGDTSIDIDRVLALDDGTICPTALRWCNTTNSDAAEKLVAKGALIHPEGDALYNPLGSWPSHFVAITCKDPKASIIAAIKELYPEWEHPGFFEPDESVYGFNQVLLRTVLGRSVCIGSFTTIGRLGFGYHNGQRFPHIGSVQIGDEVEIGSGTCIDRGAIGNTIIGNRVKIDNLVHVAHNARIGDDTMIVAGAVIGGSAVIGERCFIGMGALIKNKVRIGNDATIGMGAVVTKDVPAGETWVGNPARKLEKP